MPLTRCPRCRSAVADTDRICPCGEDLACVRAELARLTSAGMGTRVIPIGVMRRLSPRARREVAAALAQAWSRRVPPQPRAAGDDLTPDERAASAELLDETIARWSHDSET